MAPVLRLQGTLRATIALSVTFCIGSVFNIPHSIWAPVSTLMVMGNLPHVGGVLDKGGQRLIGTALGGLLGVAYFCSSFWILRR